MKFTIYHTNDIHSNFEALASLNQYLKTNKQPDDILLDAGDFHDFKSILIGGTKGAGGSALLEHCHYDAVAVGNNEGFGGMEALKTMAKSSVPLLSCNLSTINKEPIPGVLPYTILTKHNKQVLVIGVTPYFGLDGAAGTFNKFFHMDGLHVENPIPIIQSILNDETLAYDLCIVLSHLGHRNDLEMAKELTGIDVIIGGHSHTYLEKPVLIGNTIVGSAGDYGKVLGKIELEVIDDSIVSFDGMSIANTFAPEEGMLALMKVQEQIAITELSKPLYSLSTSLDYSITKENDIINLLCDALALEYPCDFALINHGILEHGINTDVSKMKLLQLSPSPLNPTRVVWSGKQIKEAILVGFDETSSLLPGKGPGFRGTHTGAIGVSNAIRIHQHPFRVLFHDQPLEDDTNYDVITSDYLQRGSGYPMLETVEVAFYDGYMRDVLERHLSNPLLHALAKQRRISY